VPNPLANDLDHILAHTEGLWEELRGQRLFITGGTGFFGCWLLESFAWANDRLGLGAEAVVLTRNPAAFAKKAPHLASHPAIRLHAGDVCTFEFPTGGFSHVIHAATETNTKLDNPPPLVLFDASTEGTRHALEFARYSGAQKFLLTSSGAVYGRQPSELTHIPEDFCGAPSPTDLDLAYGHGKRTAEFLCAAYAAEYGLEVKLARCFAFVGPYLPLDSGFAIGNFIRDAERGGPIQVKGDGTPYRSYLYAGDLAIWLWTLLVKGQGSHPYNVGSEIDLTIRNLAYAVVEVFPGTSVQIEQLPMPGAPVARYVPATGRAQSELGLTQFIDLDDAIRRTVRWHSLQSNPTGVPKGNRR
jgi:nucleoside-diphosphate-sugar epimerase